MNEVVLHVQVDVRGAASGRSHANALRCLATRHVGVEDRRLRVANILRAHSTVIQEHHLGLQALSVTAGVAFLAAARVARIRCIRS